MYIAFNAPHDPRQSPQEFVDRYPPASIPVPDNFLPVYPYHEQIGCGPGLRDEKLGPFPRTTHAVQVHRGEYYALITHMDEQIGRILDQLDRDPRAANTWIFFTADHGLAVGRHGLFGKQNMYEHSVRVPFIVVGPGVEAGRTIESPIYLQDVMPTTLTLAGVERPEYVEFTNLLPALRGQGDVGRDAVYGGYLRLQRMVIHEGWKLIVYPQAKVVRLYHVADDPHELSDLAGQPEQRARVLSLFAELQRLQAELDDPLDLSNSFPELSGSSRR
jgi:choline-sulfatase